MIASVSPSGGWDRDTSSRTLTSSSTRHSRMIALPTSSSSCSSQPLLLLLLLFLLLLFLVLVFLVLLELELELELVLFFFALLEISFPALFLPSGDACSAGNCSLSSDGAPGLLLSDRWTSSGSSCPLRSLPSFATLRVR